ncbi:hypothetical protein AAFC00_002544 [Neodothiora populina]|uniref:DUF654-domain-containing protein n=1 Tax=Neodothiora populina TaxID=2781224 RepID=A0ABR3P7K9_9PEZI
MSSRALRKAQREQEEREQLRRLQEEEGSEEENEEDDTPAPALKQSAFGAFAMLGDEDDDDDDDDDAEDAVPAVQPKTQPSDDDEDDGQTQQSPAPKSSKPKKKKKKQKARAAAAAKQDAPTPSTDGSLDEIDLALKALSTAPNGTKDGGATSAATIDPAVSETCRLLSIDTSHLHAVNEMRRLFGRAALERDGDDGDAAGGRRRRGGGGGQQNAGLAAALRGRQGQPGRTSGLAALSLRRNIFIQGKDEWPAATSGGLGMEVVEKREDGTVEYRYTHTRPYQGVQSEFETCVASMDPNRMVQLLQYNPYHISTLLQVSEIAKQERDHATSGDLLERALFSFGRAVHSTFASNLSQGKARMDFRRPENREFWLAACRYISNLGMRSTWRTVYEWSKLLLSLDPDHDPYCMALVIDQYAMRARAPQNFLDIANSTLFLDKWKSLGNIQLSKGLALVQTNQESKGKQALFTGVSKFPFVVARLLQELSIDAPPAIWGKQPRTDSEKLHSELYATRAKDLWNTPEASNLLAEVSSAISTSVPDPPVVDKPITLDEARHVLLSDTPALISNLPRSITAKVTSSSDPLPPEDDLPSYKPAPSSRGASRSAATENGTGQLGTPAENLRELHRLYAFFNDLFPWFHAGRNPNDNADNTTPGPDGEVVGATETNQQPTEEEIERRIRESGVEEHVIIARTQRMVELQDSLMAAAADQADEAGFEAAGVAGPDALGHENGNRGQAYVEDVEDESE